MQNQTALRELLEYRELNLNKLKRQMPSTQQRGPNPVLDKLGKLLQQNRRLKESSKERNQLMEIIDSQKRKIKKLEDRLIDFYEKRPQAYQNFLTDILSDQDLQLKLQARQQQLASLDSLISERKAQLDYLQLKSEQLAKSAPKGEPFEISHELSYINGLPQKQSLLEDNFDQQKQLLRSQNKSIRARLQEALQECTRLKQREQLLKKQHQAKIEQILQDALRPKTFFFSGR